MLYFQTGLFLKQSESINITLSRRFRGLWYPEDVLAAMLEGQLMYHCPSPIPGSFQHMRPLSMNRALAIKFIKHHHKDYPLPLQ